MAITNKRYAKEILTCKPLTFKGITLYPVQICDMDRFNAVKGILQVSQQSLPVELASMTYLNMIYHLEMTRMYFKEQQSGEETETPKPQKTDEKGWLDGLEELLCLCCKVEKSDIEYKTKDGEFSIIIIRGNSITADEFPMLRSIIAEQNLVELPNETHNTELVEVRNDMASIMANNDLERDFEHELYFISNNLNMSLEQIYDMTIREFYKRMASIMLQIRNQQSSNIGAAMKEYKNGNDPFPHPVYPKKDGFTHLVPDMQLKDRMKGMGSGTPSGFGNLQ